MIDIIWDFYFHSKILVGVGLARFLEGHFSFGFLQLSPQPY